MTDTVRTWWKEAVFYQIYPRSFLDTNGDGIGDLKGITRRLDYLEWLGVNAVWISPVYRSPMEDNGYDISDYRQIDPVFGTNDDMWELLKEAKRRNIRVIMDLVVNHCSDEHPWFEKAVAEPDSEEAGYFIFRKGKDGKEPNNWRSNFGGSVWEALPDGRYYMHTFSAKQPDLNWENPKLRKQIYDMMKWWLDKGISGFRVDAITFIKKDPEFHSVETEDGSRYPIENFENYPGIGKFLEEMKQEVLEPYQCMTVAEAPGVPESQLGDYEGENGYFSMIFDFTWDQFPEGADKASAETFTAWREAMIKGQLLAQKTGWCPIFLENHDQPRCPDKFFRAEEIDGKNITMLAALYFLMFGTPFIYQGQEIGMRNYPMKSMSDVYDRSAHIRFQEAAAAGTTEEEFIACLNEKGRDHARTPFQWSAGANAGFTDGTSWIPVHPDFRACNVEDESGDADSVLQFYRRLIRLRRQEPYRDIFVYGTIEFPELPGKIIGYKRKKDGREITVLCNFSGEAAEPGASAPGPGTEILLSNYENRGIYDGRLRAWEAVVCLSRQIRDQK